VSVRHLYVHVPFCAHRCGYCDFVTVTGHDSRHAAYVDALARELALRGDVLAEPLGTVYLGGGTPTLLGRLLLARLLDALPAAQEVTVEANPETVDAPLAALLAERGCRVSLGAQSFDARALAVLERRATPARVRAATDELRAAGVANLSLDLLFGVPGETLAMLDRDLAALAEIAPEHVSWYELEAKPGTRFTHRHGAELERQAALLEGHYERVVSGLEAHGYRWYETASFCRDGHRARHNLGYWEGRDYLGIGIGAVSTLGLERRRNGPRLEPYLAAAGRGAEPPCAIERLTPRERAWERVMLGLRLDQPLVLDGLAGVLDAGGVERMRALGLAECAEGTIRLSRRGRMLANDVISTMLAA